MSHHVTITLSQFHLLQAIAGVLVILIAVSVLKALNGGRRRRQSVRPQYTTPQKHRKPALLKRLGRGASRCIYGIDGVLFWYIVFPVLYPLALFVGTRRAALIAPSSLTTLRETIIAHNHRCGHPVCLPFLLWPQWFVRCRGCKRWVHMREVPSLHGDTTVLQQLQGSLLAARCAVQYIEAPATPAAAAPPVPPAPVAAPAAPAASHSHATQGQTRTA